MKILSKQSNIFENINLKTFKLNLFKLIKFELSYYIEILIKMF